MNEIELSKKLINKIYPDINLDKYKRSGENEISIYDFMVRGGIYFFDFKNKDLNNSVFKIIRFAEERSLKKEDNSIVNNVLMILICAAYNEGMLIREQLWELYNDEYVFQQSLSMGSEYSIRILSELFFYAFTKLDKNAIDKLYNNYVTKLNKRTGEYSIFIKEIPWYFNTSLSKGLPLTIDNCKEYILLKEYIIQLLPSLKYKTIQFDQNFKLVVEASEGLKEIVSYIDQMENFIYWTQMNTLTEFIEFDYIYPNGTEGDILKYIFDEYGQNYKCDGLIWHGKVSKEYYELFSILYPVSDTCGYKIKTISEDVRFNELFNHHIPTIIDNMTQKFIGKGIGYFKLFREFQKKLDHYRKEQTRKRAELNSQLILQGRKSPKWKSEAQLYALVSSVYPDAIYQYRNEWLNYQSLDIFIPSMKIGIEYQGVQHYKPIEYFGGNEHFKIQQVNDCKKRKKCIDNGVFLIEWPYDLDINIKNLETAIKMNVDGKS